MNGYLLDTSILSILGDPRRPQHRAVLEWYSGVPSLQLFTSTVVIGELAQGVAGLPDGQRRRRYEHQLHQVVLPAFEDRLLPFDLDCALEWGDLMGEGRRRGRIPPSDDAKIAAVAIVHGLMVTTDNLRDFEPMGVPCLNPALG